MAYMFAVAFVLIMVGELADKSQLMAMTLATRYKAWQVLVGIFIATFVVHFFTTLVGQAVGGFIPQAILPWFTGFLFIGFGIWTLRGDAIDESEADRGAGRYGPIIATTIAFFLAELGDKTQIMTLTIAADPGLALVTYLKDAGPAVQRFFESTGLSPSETTEMARFWAVTLGSTVGMVMADAVAIVVGRFLGKKMPEKTLRMISGTFFIIFGVLAILSAYLG